MRRYKILHLGEEKVEPTVKADKPKDWKFMEQSGEVLADIPATWMAYKNDVEGMRGIISMEYHEFKKAENEKEMSHELVHLASACLYLWRHLNDAAE